MRKAHSIQVGQRFGKLVAIECVGRDKKNNNYLWKCKCDCGQYTITRSDRLVRGNTKSCGCLKHTSHRKGKTFISQEDRTLTSVLRGMKNRCYNPNSLKYKNYGAMGITICEEWQHINKFREWAYNNGYKPGLTIDRIDVNGNYEPSNCRWITIQEQQHNKRSNRYITYKGETKCLAEWAHILGISFCTLKYRVYNWKDIERAFTTPVRGKGLTR